MSTTLFATLSILDNAVNNLAVHIANLRDSNVFCQCGCGRTQLMHAVEELFGVEALRELIVTGDSEYLFKLLGGVSTDVLMTIMKLVPAGDEDALFDFLKRMAQHEQAKRPGAIYAISALFPTLSPN